MLTKEAREKKKRKKEEAEKANREIVNRIEKYNIGSTNPNFLVIDSLCETAKSLYNCVNWQCRNAYKANEKIPSYIELEKLASSGTIDYLTNHFRDLPIQTAQQVISQVTTDWSNYFKALKEYRIAPTKFLGKPNPPGYKYKRTGIVIPQAFSVKSEYISFLKRNGFKPIKLFGKYSSDKIKSVRIVPHATNYQVIVTYEIEIQKGDLNVIEDKLRRILGIDMGVNNFVACANNVGLRPFIISGRYIKSINQLYNKAIAKVKEKLPYFKAKKKWKQQKTSKKIKILSDKRSRILDDLLHKISTFLVNYCLHYRIDTIVIGHNSLWKQESNIGKRNNQNFVYIPFSKFLEKLKYKCKSARIQYVEITEEYTSKCSFLDNEPLCHQDKYLGKRIVRGLFSSSTGRIINADINGALNMIRKVFPNAFYFIDGKRDRGCGLDPVKLYGISRLTMLQKNPYNDSQTTLTNVPMKNNIELLKNFNSCV